MGHVVTPALALTTSLREVEEEQTLADFEKHQTQTWFRRGCNPICGIYLL